MEIQTSSSTALASSSKSSLALSSTSIVSISPLRLFLAYFFFIWYLVIVLVASLGFYTIITRFRHSPDLAPSSKHNHQELDQEEEEIWEGVTIIRPIKGIDPELMSCLESSFQQNYPIDKLQILFCIDDPLDPSIPLIQKLINKYSNADAEILISKNYNILAGHSDDYFGPNPKVNNLSKGFIASKFDILWIMDSNVWASENILRNSVKSLNENLNNGTKVASHPRSIKLVHHVPLAISINGSNQNGNENKDEDEYVLTPVESKESISTTGSSTSYRSTPPPPGITSTLLSTSSSSPTPIIKNKRKRFLKKYGAKLDEMFLMTSHSKFYISLNNLSVAPCVNGKSNIYRKSDLDKSVSLMSSAINSQFFGDSKVINDSKILTSESMIPGNSIKFFSRYIGEDNMIGIALWENCMGKTGLSGDIVIQPLSGADNSINDYMKRRIRWLRVRKYMVLMATLVEPTTESIICGIYGTFAVSNIFLNQWFSWYYFIIHLIIWCGCDYYQYYTFVNNINGHKSLPHWLINLPPKSRKFINWWYIWVLREILALPIWILAMIGHEIDWRGKPFMIKKDLTAEEL
ncbi:ceramide glucosyltransferase [Scheffersomyces amazonensis]|uniref:ceramide glucosyltransferase n=1 Tax=Scheffersomyces amazonensis TaxID=1078765 RepID=UPI00315DFF42